MPVSANESAPTAPSAGAARPRKLHDLAYGIERIGLIPLRAPIVSAIILALLCIVAASASSGSRSTIRSASCSAPTRQEFRQYEEVTKRFPSTEFDVLVVVEGKNADGAGVDREAARPRHRPAADRQRARADLAVLGPPAAGGGQAAGAGVPGDAADRARNTTRWSQRVLSNEIIRGKLLSEDGTLALIVLALDPKIVGGKGLNTTVGEIRKVMQEDLGGDRADGAARRRADHAARDPQRRRARHAALQHHRLRSPAA